MVLVSRMCSIGFDTIVVFTLWSRHYEEWKRVPQAGIRTSVTALLLEDSKSTDPAFYKREPLLT